MHLVPAFRGGGDRHLSDPGTGRYNDILEADRHYIALDADLANAPEAIERFRDPAERRRIADAGQALVHDAHTYRHRLAALHRAVSTR